MPNTRERLRIMSKLIRQNGMTLIELLVAGVISLIAAAGMIAVMANTLGTGTQTIKMTKLTQDMRAAMQIMSRELRRANFHRGYMACFGNMNCLKEAPDPDDSTSTVDISNEIGEIEIFDSGDSDCFWFWYDRPNSDGFGGGDEPPVAAFRRTTEAVGDLTVGKLQMTISDEDMDIDCDPNADWTDITDPELVDITEFNVSDASVVETVNENGDTQGVGRIGLAITARLTPDTSVPAWLQTGTNPNAARVLQEFIKVRNHTTTVASASP